MALNQTIFSPLTNFSGSITAFTYPGGANVGNALQIISSSLPAYQATGWQYKTSIVPFKTTNTAQQNVTDLQLNLVSGRKYIINGYLFGSTIRAANGFRVGVALSNVESHYAIEVPTTTTAITYGFSITANAGSGPGSSLTNYYLVQLKAIAIATGTPATFTPTISSEGAGGGATDVAIGPSVIYYREY